MLKVTALTLAAVVGAAGGAGVAVHAGGRAGADLADRPMAKHIMGRIGRLMVLHSELDVTAEQRGQLRTIAQSHKQEIAQALQPVVAAGRALNAAAAADPVDEAAVKAAAAAFGEALGQAALVVAPIKAEASQVLTADQLDTLDTFHADKTERVDAFLSKLAESD